MVEMLPLMKDPKFWDTLKSLDVFWDSTLRTNPMEICGIEFTHEVRGGCIWNQIRLLRGDDEVYRISRGDDFETRYERFYGVFIRSYHGNQFSFCEYVDGVRELGKIPTKEQVFDRAGNVILTSNSCMRCTSPKMSCSGSRMVDGETLDMYKRYARRMVS